MKWEQQWLCQRCSEDQMGIHAIPLLKYLAYKKNAREGKRPFVFFPLTKRSALLMATSLKLGNHYDCVFFSQFPRLC